MGNKRRKIANRKYRNNRKDRKDIIHVQKQRFLHYASQEVTSRRKNHSLSKPTSGSPRLRIWGCLAEEPTVIEVVFSPKTVCYSIMRYLKVSPIFMLPVYERFSL